MSELRESQTHWPEPRILTLRQQRVVVDADLARIYGVTTAQLNQQVSRNRSRFPLDFMWRVTPHEKWEVITICDHLKNLKYSSAMPRVFTEHGAIMVASLLNSSRAVEMSVFVVRAFVKYRELLTRNEAFGNRLAELESKVAGHDESIREIVAALRKLYRDGAEGEARPIAVSVKVVVA